MVTIHQFGRPLVPTTRERCRPSRVCCTCERPGQLPAGSDGSSESTASRSWPTPAAIWASPWTRIRRILEFALGLLVSARTHQNRRSTAMLGYEDRVSRSRGTLHYARRILAQLADRNDLGIALICATSLVAARTPDVRPSRSNWRSHRRCCYPWAQLDPELTTPTRRNSQGSETVRSRSPEQGTHP